MILILQQPQVLPMIITILLTLDLIMEDKDACKTECLIWSIELDRDLSLQPQVAQRPRREKWKGSRSIVYKYAGVIGTRLNASSCLSSRRTVEEIDT